MMSLAAQTTRLCI